MWQILNLTQRKALSEFFVNVGVAWFAAAFVTPSVVPNFRLLTLLMHVVNMCGAVYLALYLLREEI